MSTAGQVECTRIKNSVCLISSKSQKKRNISNYTFLIITTNELTAAHCLDETASHSTKKCVLKFRFSNVQGAII